MPSPHPAASDASPWRRLALEEQVGKKGRSLPGSHRSHGFLAMAGPQVESKGRIDAHIADASATLLHRLGVSVPSSFMGRVLWEALAEPAAGRIERLPEITGVHSRVPGEDGIVESRLRALGYIE